MKLLASLVLPAAFFVVATGSRGPSPKLFGDASVLDLKLEAPLEQLFAEAKHRPSASVRVDGTLGYTDAQGKAITIRGIKVSVRGNTSRRDTECTFPKLRFDFDPVLVPDGSLFAGIDTLKIGTHCADRPDGALTQLGRWANEKSPIREALTYHLVAAAGVKTLEARPARITYVDGPHVLSRGAVLVEDQHAAVLRFGGVHEVKQFTNARDMLDDAEAALLAFGEAMIGNFDWSLRFSPEDFYRNAQTHPLWNALAATRPDGTVFPLIYDFDLAGTVTGDHPWFGKVYYEGFLPSRSHKEIEVLGQVQRTRTLFSHALLDRARRRLIDSKPAIYRTLDEAHVDDEGRRIARAYLDSFFASIADARAFYRPIVRSSNALRTRPPTAIRRRAAARTGFLSEPASASRSSGEAHVFASRCSMCGGIGWRDALRSIAGRSGSIAKR